MRGSKYIKVILSYVVEFNLVFIGVVNVIGFFFWRLSVKIWFLGCF